MQEAEVPRLLHRAQRVSLQEALQHGQVRLQGQQQEQEQLRGHQDKTQDGQVRLRRRKAVQEAGGDCQEVWEDDAQQEEEQEAE